MRVGIRARAALTAAVSKKAFMMASANSELRAEIVQFVSTDINRVYQGIQQIHYLWTAPIEAITIISLVAYQVKQYVAPGEFRSSTILEYTCILQCLSTADTSIRR